MESNHPIIGTIAIIPARAGSKGIPGKNKRLLGGEPLVQWTFEAALGAKSIDQIYVTTDDVDIEMLAANMGISTLGRPKCLAQDDVQLDEVVLFNLRQLNHNLNVWPERIVLLSPTSPFRGSQHIDEAVAAHLENYSVLSMSKNMRFHWSAGAGEATDILHNPTRRYGRQEIREWLYEENGAIYVFNADRLAREKTYRYPPYIPYIMNTESSIDIDTELDLLWAEFLISQHPGAKAFDDARPVGVGRRERRTAIAISALDGVSMPQPPPSTERKHHEHLSPRWHKNILCTGFGIPKVSRPPS